MFFRYLVALFILLPSLTMAQRGSLSGKVTDSRTGKGIANVNVFLSNATKGAQTDSNGSFVITNIRSGSYELIASLVGYNIFSKSVSIDDNPQTQNISLEEKIIELGEVKVTPDKNWAANFDQFKRDFIGRGPNSAMTKIVNPQAVRIYYDINNNVLEASSDEFLILENRALGYRLKYLLSKFNKDFRSGLRYYEGPVLFEELSGGRGQQKRWKENRLRAYLGSDMHLLRSLIKGDLNSNGFVLHTLIRKDNPNRPPDSLIKAKMRSFRPIGILSKSNGDSLQYWTEKARIPKILQYLTKDTLKASDVAKRTDQFGIFALKFDNCLYVIYKNKQVNQSGIYKPVNIGGYPVNIISLQEEYALFGSNGVIVNPQSVIYEGLWGGGVSDMLPNDYEP